MERQVARMRARLAAVGADALPPLGGFGYYERDVWGKPPHAVSRIQDLWLYVRTRVCHSGTVVGGGERA